MQLIIRMNDIQTPEQIYTVVDEFYKKLLADEKISYIFTDVVQIKLEEHLPILVTFWSQAILAIDENFEGFNCERMKNQAHNLSTIMQIKIAQQKQE